MQSWGRHPPDEKYVCAICIPHLISASLNKKSRISSTDTGFFYVYHAMTLLLYRLFSGRFCASLRLFAVNKSRFFGSVNAALSHNDLNKL